MNPAVRRTLNNYRPAMEFAGRVDFTRDIDTWRPIAKWAPRIKVGDLIEVERVHQRKPGRFYARVLRIENPATLPIPGAERGRLATIYPKLTLGELMKITLRVEPGATRNDKRFTTWETKTTSAHGLRRD